MRCGMAARARATASWWWVRESWGCWSHPWRRGLPGADGYGRRYRCRRRRDHRGPGRRLCPARACTAATPMSCFTPAPARRPQHRHQLRRVRGNYRGDELVRRPARDADLGGAFHSRRLKFVSSQVGPYPPTRRPRWDYRPARGGALRLLADPALDAARGRGDRIRGGAARLPHILAAGAHGLAPVIRYPAA